ncbi:MAG: TonB-dependent receptor plug domain-containing protein, partial [Opitutaceae bacterium]
MNHRRIVILTTLLPAALIAQVVTPTKPADTEAIVLSPFVVDTSADQGYQASSTLAGSRLKTELKDVAASVTVLTNEFLDDLAATNITDALAFVAGAENDATTDPTSVSSNGQGYLGGDFGDVNNRSDEVRVRGLGRASNTLNFIQVIGTSDRYNTERAEFLRGANSVLFGLAEPAGLINSTTKVAKLRRNQTSLDTKFDNFGSARTVLDVNRVIVKDRLAVRAVGLESNTRYQVKNAFYHDRRMFLTGTYQPFQNTTLRVNYEAQNLRGMRPNFRTVQDNVSGWLNAYNQYARVLTPAQIAAAFYWDPTVPPTSTGAPLASTFTT